MIAREWIDLLRVLHGAYNTLVALALLYQGWLGLKIRKARRTGSAKDFGVIRRHRGNGPVLALLGILGYVAGATLIIIDKGHIFEYRVHHLVGLVDRHPPGDHVPRFPEDQGPRLSLADTAFPAGPGHPGRVLGAAVSGP